MQSRHTDTQINDGHHDDDRDDDYDDDNNDDKDGDDEGGKEPRSGCVPLRRGVGEEGRAGKNPAAVVYRSAGG